MREDETQQAGWSAEGLGYLNRKASTKQKVFVIHPHEKNDQTYLSGRSADARLEEALNLTAAIDVDLIGGEIITLRQVKPSTYIGAGKLDEMKEFSDAHEIDLFIFDCTLTPIQQRNLEKYLDVKVIDRTALILEIFGNRASTKEGELQVELAHLIYQKSRLVRSWTHLERQRGGAGFLGGPGETQIESDRRIIDDKVARIKKQLENVSRTRKLHRSRRQKAPYPVIALVGYTNAGKSTLFNRLTHADVLAEDMLFATLDPTMRSVKLPSGRKIILSDTVGFISDLPTMLVAAFRATLEEVLEADIILHVRDAAHADTETQRQDVLDVLDELNESDAVIGGAPIIEALNKTDMLSDDQHLFWGQASNRKADQHLLSALTGKGCTELLEAIDARLGASDLTLQIKIAFKHGAAIAWLKANSLLLSHATEKNHMAYDVKMDPLHFKRFKSQFSGQFSVKEIV